MQTGQGCTVYARLKLWRIWKLKRIAGYSAGTLAGNAAKLLQQRFLRLALLLLERCFKHRDRIAASGWRKLPLVIDSAKNLGPVGPVDVQSIGVGLGLGHSGRIGSPWC